MVTLRYIGTHQPKQTFEVDENKAKELLTRPDVINVDNLTRENLIKMNEKEQSELLKKLGLTNKEIGKLQSEKEKIDKILELIGG